MNNEKLRERVENKIKANQLKMQEAVVENSEEITITKFEYCRGYNDGIEWLLKQLAELEEE